jgi:hypothetical protein
MSTCVVCIECHSRRPEIREWCRPCYQRVRHRKDFSHIQAHEPLEVRRCLHCLAPLPVGRTIKGRCSACDAYNKRTGQFRPVDRERALESVSIVAEDVVKGSASVSDLADAVRSLTDANEKYMAERHATKIRAAREAGTPRRAKWFIADGG